ncbi:MAG: prolyl oligopeptidase family serine peptidase [Terracidiphilus sp.]
MNTSQSTSNAATALPFAMALATVILFLIAHPTTAQEKPFTIEQALSAPFTSDLTAAPAKGRLAWQANIDGRRNLWVAEPAPGGKGYVSRQVTHYNEDDGQELNDLQWTPDAASLIYVRGSGAQGEGHPVPNPAWFPKGAQQQLWMVSADGGEPRLLGEGRAPQVSPGGKMVAYVLKGQLWAVRLDDPNAKPQQLLETRGSAQSLRWSPNGSHLAFVSDRDDHSFIADYSVAAGAVTYLDPSTDLDNNPTWSPDSTRIAFLRIPPDKDSLFFVAHRTALPWSIRVADVASGKGHEIFHAAEGVGSAYHETDSLDQLHWTLGDRIVFPWEREGWLHLYAVPVAGGSATPLTQGNFEVEHVSLSANGKTLVFDSNQNDIDHRHVWRVDFAADSANNAANAVTIGDMWRQRPRGAQENENVNEESIETQPVVTSDGTIAVLRSDVRLPIRAAVVAGESLVDLAPQAIPADFPAAKFVAPQQVIFTGADGLEIHGQLFLPAGIAPSERRPAMVFFHGGSMRQMLLGWHYMEYYSNAYAMNQYLCSLGYIVLSVNYRSGIGYGLNFREALNYGASGASEFNDVMGAGLYLKSRPDVDGARIGSWGGSYGGYLTALALARASNLFAAGVDMHGVHDWNSELPTFSRNYDPREHADTARLAFESSPISSVSTWRSPVLLIHGDDDRNVPFAETELLVEALRRQKVDFEELIFPDEIHDFLLRRDWVRAYTASAEFLNRKLAK